MGVFACVGAIILESVCMKDQYYSGFSGTFPSLDHNGILVLYNPYYPSTVFPFKNGSHFFL